MPWSALVILIMKSAPSSGKYLSICILLFCFLSASKCLQLGTWSGWQWFDFKMQIYSSSVSNTSHSLWITGYLNHVHGEKQMCKKTSPIMLVSWRFSLLYCEMYWLKQSTTKSKARGQGNIPHSVWCGGDWLVSEC